MNINHIASKVAGRKFNISAELDKCTYKQLPNNAKSPVSTFVVKGILNDETDYDGEIEFDGEISFELDGSYVGWSGTPFVMPKEQMYEICEALWNSPCFEKASKEYNL